MSNTLTIGDSVLWRGAWGKDMPKETTVTTIEVKTKGSKNGQDVLCHDWSKMNTRDVILDLGNGYWCYGFQVKQIKSF